MAERSQHQQRIIRNYYENRESIALQRLQELVTELYLTEGKKRAQHWKSVGTQLEKLGVSASQIEHLQQQDDPELLAQQVAKLMEKSS